MYCTITIELFKGLKKMDTPGNLVDSPTHRYGESIFDYEYLHELEAKIETARKLMCETYADLNYAKTSENSVHCCVPLIKNFLGLTVVINEQIL